MAQTNEQSIRTTFTNTELETLHELTLEEFIPLIEAKLGTKLYSQEGIKIKNHTVVLTHDPVVELDVDQLIDTVREDYLVALAKSFRNVPTEAINLRLPSITMSNSNGSLKIVYGTD